MGVHVLSSGEVSILVQHLIHVPSTTPSVIFFAFNMSHGEKYFWDIRKTLQRVTFCMPKNQRIHFSSCHVPSGLSNFTRYRKIVSGQSIWNSKGTMYTNFKPHPMKKLKKQVFASTTSKTFFLLENYKGVNQNEWISS